MRKNLLYAIMSIGSAVTAVLMLVIFFLLLKEPDTGMTTANLFGVRILMTELLLATAFYVIGAQICRVNHDKFKMLGVWKIFSSFFAWL